GVVMFNKVNIPLIGVVENMSYHICANCGHQEALFGAKGADKLAAEQKLDVLARIPLHIALREDLDNGTPTVIQRAGSELSQQYLALADKVSANLYWQGKMIPESIAIKSMT